MGQKWNDGEMKRMPYPTDEAVSVPILGQSFDITLSPRDWSIAASTFYTEEVVMALFTIRLSKLNQESLIIEIFAAFLA